MAIAVLEYEKLRFHRGQQRLSVCGRGLDAHTDSIHQSIGCVLSNGSGACRPASFSNRFEALVALHVECFQNGGQSQLFERLQASVPQDQDMNRQEPKAIHGAAHVKRVAV